VRENEDDEPCASVWLWTVQERLAAHDYAAAAQVAACAIIEFPLDGRFWELGGVTYWMEGETQAAIRYLEEATMLKPLHPFAQVALADGYAQLGKNDLSRTIWEFLATADGGSRLIRFLGQSSGELADDFLGCTVYQTVTNNDPLNHHGWFGLGVCLARLGGDLGRVTESLAVAVRLAPGIVPYRLTLAELCLAAGDHDRTLYVLGPLDACRFRCPCLLRRACDLYLQLGDTVRVQEYRRQLDLLTSM